MFVQERSHQCEQCGKNFSQETSLRKHKCVHKGEKPYHCKQCGKKVCLEGNLKTHQHIHTGDKPYHCLLCGSRFAYPPALKKHECCGENQDAVPAHPAPQGLRLLYPHYDLCCCVKVHISMYLSVIFKLSPTQLLLCILFRFRKAESGPLLIIEVYLK